jgi:hypothetical protein
VTDTWAEPGTAGYIIHARQEIAVPQATLTELSVRHDTSNSRRKHMSVSAKSSPRNQHYRASGHKARPKILFELSA